jgi:pimeloyl-ACP methyl ester carboxylesterase
VGRLQTNRISTLFAHSDQAETVVLLHSSASSGSQWRTLCGLLESDFAVLAPDLYGYGASADWPGRTPITLAHEAAAVSVSLGNQDKPVHIVGHSYGGAVALKLALESRIRLRSLTLIEPVAFHLLRQDTHGSELYNEVCRVGDSVRQSVACGDYWGGMGRFIDYWNGTGTWDRLAEEKRAALATRTSKVALDFYASTAEDTPLSAYHGIAAPVLILRGEYTPAPTRRIAELLTHAIPGSQLQTVPDAGHMAPLTHTEFVNTAVRWHLLRNTLPRAQHTGSAVAELNYAVVGV